jgi:hypothetical protein
LSKIPCRQLLAEYAITPTLLILSVWFKEIVYSTTLIKNWRLRSVDQTCAHGNCVLVVLTLYCLLRFDLSAGDDLLFHTGSSRALNHDPSITDEIIDVEALRT